MVKNLPASAGDMDSIAGPGRFPHTAGQLGLGVTAAEPASVLPINMQG